MFRIYKDAFDLTLDTTEGEEPPRPVVPVRQRALARPPTLGLATAAQFDNGIAPDRELRFASTENVGLLLWSSVEIIRSIYEAGGAFNLDTDLVGPPGASVVTYQCLWSERAAPEFTPAAHGQRWYMDLLIRATEVA